MTRDLFRLPPNLPVPADDRAAAHLFGMELPDIPLISTDAGKVVSLARTPGKVAVFAFPRTGRPDQAPLTPDWDRIPGARGCTPQVCRYRDLHTEFAALQCTVFGLSTQDAEYQHEMATRLQLPFPVLSDSGLALTKALRLPTMNVAGHVLHRRLAWLALDGRIAGLIYPVFPPDQNADRLLELLAAMEK